MEEKIGYKERFEILQKIGKDLSSTGSQYILAKELEDVKRKAFDNMGPFIDDRTIKKLKELELYKKGN